MERYHCVIDTTRGWERWEEIDRGVRPSSNKIKWRYGYENY